MVCLLEGRQTSFLVALLDLRTAFDTLYHSIPLQEFETTYGVRDTVLDWFTSLFSTVIVDSAVSVSHPLVYGIPQGSALGPVLFSVYSQPLSDVVSVMIVTFTSMQTILNCPRVLLPISSTVFSPAFKHVLVIF